MEGLRGFEFGIWNSGSGGLKIVELIASIVKSRRGCCSATLMKSLRVAESHQLYLSLSHSVCASLCLSSYAKM